MGFIVIIFCCVVVMIWLKFLWSRRSFYKIAFQLPGPMGWPFIGIGLKMMNPEKYLPYMERKSKNYKSPLISWMGTSCFLYVNDPQTAELIFNAPQCINKGDFYRFMASAIGDGLFTSSAPRWNIHRRLINPAFSRPILDNFFPIFNKEAGVLVKKLQRECGKNIEIYEILKRSVLEAACRKYFTHMINIMHDFMNSLAETTMGQKMNFQNNEASIIFDAYNSITEICVRRMLSPWLYSDFVFNRSKLFDHQQKIAATLRAFVENLLGYNKADLTFKFTNNEKSFEKINNSCDDSGYDNLEIKKSKAIFIEQVRNYIQQGQISCEDVRDEANVIIAATFETTSTALYFVCLCLAMHPEYQDKLFDELKSVFSLQNSGNNSNGDIHITKEDLDSMSYTEMVINEAMRLFSPVPMVLRRVSEKGCKLEDNITLPVGTQIGIDIFNMQRSESVWGKHSKQFCPDLHFGSMAKKRHPFAFIPFTKGLRMCLGSRYAIILMKIFIAKLFLNFRLNTNARLEDLHVKGTISLKLLQYPTFIVIPRNS